MQGNFIKAMEMSIEELMIWIAFLPMEIYLLTPCFRYGFHLDMFSIIVVQRNGKNIEE